MASFCSPIFSLKKMGLQALKKNFSPHGALMDLLGFTAGFDEWFSLFIPRARQGNYFIVWLAPDYSAAAVGTPDRKCLWILARQPALPVATYHQIVEHCRKLGFPVENLIVETAQGH